MCDCQYGEQQRQAVRFKLPISRTSAAQFGALPSACSFFFSANSRIGARPQLVQAIKRSFATNCRAFHRVGHRLGRFDLVAGHVDHAHNHVLASSVHQLRRHVRVIALQAELLVELAASAGRSVRIGAILGARAFFQSTLALMP